MMPMLFLALACEEAEITFKRSTSANEEAERKRAENATRGLYSVMLPVLVRTV